MQRGFQPSKIETTDYRLGGAFQLQGQPLVPDGQWDKWLPPVYDQNPTGQFEPNDCVTCAITAAVETLMNQEFSETQRLSRRWLAWATGTGSKGGNDPTTVCRFLGKSGDVHMTDWPDDFQNFYATPPQNLYTLAKAFIAEFEYDNQWVPANPDAMKQALTRSPLTVAGYAWHMNKDGYYDWPQGYDAEHYFLIYGYEDGKFWKVFDTYEANFKSLVWDYPFVQVKEHTLHRQVVNPSAFDMFVQWLRQALGLDGVSFGAARSAKWPQVQKAFLAEHPTCAVCGKKGGVLNPLNVHHQRPFHLHPELELDPNNLITLCRVHHLWWGHLGNWASFNIDVLTDSAAWFTKITNRP